MLAFCKGTKCLTSPTEPRTPTVNAQKEDEFVATKKLPVFMWKFVNLASLSWPQTSIFSNYSTNQTTTATHDEAN